MKRGRVMVNLINNKHIVITGASSGIGKQMAMMVAMRGGNVSLIARSTEKLIALRDQLKEEYNANVDSYTLDISDLEEVSNVFNKIIKTKGPVDVLINNAGFGIFDSAQDVDLREVERMFSVNVVGLIACTKMVLPNMINNNTGHIINIASLAGKVATPKSTVYSATKHAVLGFTNGLRMELSDTHINVTLVNPGPIQTNFFNIADPNGSYQSNIKKYILKPEKVSEQIINVIGTKKREINLPWSMAFGAKLYQWFPNLSERVASRLFRMK